MSPTPSPRRVRVRAYAKINLTLRVLGIHQDGYHELRTTFQSLALHDTLTFERTRGAFVITSDDSACPADESNLVWQAAERLWVESGRPGHLRGVHVHVAKRIPVQAGLGGGSSDAAATLRALRMLWRLETPDGALEAIGRGLGADVAFFLVGGSVLGVDRGDLLFPLEDRRPSWVVLARPGFGVSTRDAYAWWDAAHAVVRRDVTPPGDRKSEWVNDLQAPVVARHPAIAELIQTLEQAGSRHAAMSGSGSAVFGLFDTEAAAARASRRLSAPGVNTWITRTTSRRQHLRASAPRPVAG